MERVARSSAPGVACAPRQAWVLAGGERVKIVIEGLDQSYERTDDIHICGGEIRDTGISEGSGLAAAERKDDVRADLCHGGRDIGQRFEAGAVELQYVSASAGLKVGDDVVSVACMDNKGVAASSTRQHIIASTAVDHVVAGIADNDVAEIIASGRGINATRQRQVFDIGSVNQTVAIVRPGHDCIDALTSLFDDLGAVVKDHIGVISRAPD